MAKDKHGNDVFLPDGSRPQHTGQGLTIQQKEYFKKPRGMAEIATQLFNGDYWAANHFQNKFIGGAVLKINEDATIQLIEWD